MKRGRDLFLSIALVAVWSIVAPAVSAQDNRGNSLEAGILAFREHRFEDAERIFQTVVEREPTESEAHFLLARVYSETPLENRRRAQRSLDRAIELEPDNVQYLVARLILLRTESWNFVVDKIREAKRRELALEILALDSTNAFAHEEMGVSYIRDFWRYRNAVMIPDFDLARRWKVPGGPIDNELAMPTDLGNIDGMNGDPGGEDPISPLPDIDNPFLRDRAMTVRPGQVESIESPDEVFLADEFDLDRLESHGIAIRDLSQRATRVYNRAVAHLEIALESNPRQESTYRELMKVFALRGDYGTALRMLQQMYVYFPDDAETWLYLGLSNYKAGLPEAGAKSFERAMELADAETRRIFEDIRFIVPVAEQAAYDADPIGYASRFWTSKDPRYLTTYNERKTEHYARLVYADLLYGASAIDRHGWDTERGQILVRYGIPKADVVIIPDRGIDETGPTRQTQTFDPLEERVESVNELEALEILNTYNIWDYGDFRFVFEDPFRTGEFRLYSPSAEALSQRALPWQNDYVIEAAQIIRETPETYTYSAPGRNVELPFLVNAFKGTDGKADVYLSYGIPVNEYDRDDDLIEVTASEGTFVIGNDRQILVEQRRTIYGLQTAQVQDFEEQSLWVNSREVSAGPGAGEVSIELEINEADAVAVQRRAIEIPDFEAPGLVMSDVMLAYSIEDTPDGTPLAKGEIVRNGYSIQPAPWSVFSGDQPIYLYFEFYNLALEGGASAFEIEGRLEKKDTSTGVRRLVRGLFGRGTAGVSVRQPGTGSTPDESQYLIMDAGGEEPGLYTLVVIVTDSRSGRSVEKEVDLFLE